MRPERTRIKICGIREPDHARLAASAGADAIGLVFHPQSPRAVDSGRAAEIVAALPPFTLSVALFVDAPVAAVEAVLARVSVDLLQFHGSESPEYCAAFGRPFLRAVPMGEGGDLLEYARRFSRAKGLLLDAHRPGEAGGTGRSFDWTRIPHDLPLPIVLSGGLDAANVGRAIRESRPWAVDVSSGVERSRGVKDPAMIIEFIRSVRLEDVRPA